jgi:hypothetical protein
VKLYFNKPLYIERQGCISEVSIGSLPLVTGDSGVVLPAEGYLAEPLSGQLLQLITRAEMELDLVVGWKFPG